MNEEIKLMMTPEECKEKAKQLLQMPKEDLLTNYMFMEQRVEQLEKENKELKQPQVFIDCEDMEERYGRDLYEDYLKGKIEQLEKENERLKEWKEDLLKENIELENIRKEAIEYINKNWHHWCSDHCKYATETINILNKGNEQ